MQANFLRSGQKVFEPDPFLSVREEECLNLALVADGDQILGYQVAGLGWDYENV